MLHLFQSFTVVPLEMRGWFYIAGAAALLLMLGGSIDRMHIWVMGKSERRGPLVGAGLGRLLWLSLTGLFGPDCLFARRVFARSRWRGGMVMAFVWSSIALALAAGLSAIFYFVNLALPAGLMRWADPVLDLAGLLLLLGLMAALGRRYLFRPDRWISVSADGLLLILFTLAVVSGLAMEGARLVGSEAAALARWPVGTGFAALLGLVNREAGFWAAWYPALYLAHAGSGLALIAYLPFSKLFHLFASQITTYAASRPRPTRSLQEVSRRGTTREGREGMEHHENAS